ncbi:hypothetical protein PCK1_001791 [Pneumocystis canis]|nr:hypothetical protein PCK1_001791 [Pneumocystis canis]
MKSVFIYTYLLIITTITRAVYLLTHNSLDPKEPVYSFLLLNPGRSCSDYHEKLLEYTGMKEETRNKIYTQLKCHHKNHPNKYDYYYIGINPKQLSNDQHKCTAIKIKDGSLINIHCKGNYPSICTNSGPKRTQTSGISNSTGLLHSVYSYYGKIVGTRTDISFVFLGIPYAFPPIGKLRFEDPVCISKIKGTWDASYFRPPCPQNNPPPGNSFFNENCLFLNIYTPYIPDAKDNKEMLLPVMVWIHGGSFVRGDVSEAFNDPSHLVSREKVVVVTFNYRLGALGFWGSRNQGIKDQITVLEWIRDFIEDFGGDPNKVTLSGESAGANSVRALLFAKTKTEGLFHAAVLASDPLYLGFSTKDDSENVLSHNMVKAVNCPTETRNINDKNVLDCMREVSVEAIINAQEKVGIISSISASSITRAQPYKPCIDGVLFKEDFYELLLKGDFVKVPIMLGFLKDEGHFFLANYKASITKTLFLPTLAFIFSKHHSLLIQNSALYSYYANDAKDSARHALANILTLYAYYYTYPYMWLHSTDSFCYGHACHADDLISFLGSLSIPGVQVAYYNNQTTSPSSKDIKFLSIFLARYGSFIRTHDPNPSFNTLCYNAKDFMEDNSKKTTVHWDNFAVNNSLEDAPTPNGLNTPNGKIYGPLHILAEKEGITGPYGFNKTICDFWLTHGTHFQIHLRKNTLNA